MVVGATGTAVPALCSRPGAALPVMGKRGLAIRRLERGAVLYCIHRTAAFSGEQGRGAREAGLTQLSNETFVNLTEKHNLPFDMQKIWICAGAFTRWV